MLIQKDKKNSKELWLCAILLWGVLSFLFFRMSIAYDVPEWDDKLYRSDFPLHLRDSVNGVDYSLNNLVFRAFAKFIVLGENGYRIFNICSSVYLAAIVAFTPFALKFLFEEIISLSSGICEKPSERQLNLISVISLFIIGLIIPGVFDYFYRGTVAISLWQNPTYFTMRLFGTLAMAYFIKIKNRYLTPEASEVLMKDYILFGLFFFLANYAKPNFTIAFGPMFVGALLIDFFKKRIKGTFLKVLRFGVFAVPTLFLLVWQYFVILITELNDDNKAVVMPFASYMVEGSHPILKMICFILLPLVLFWFSYRTIKQMKSAYMYIGVYWILQWLVYILMAEQGTHFEDGNFSWGSIHANYLLYATLIFAFVCEVKRRLSETNVVALTKMDKVLFYIKNTWPIVLIAYQTLCGFIYFYHILCGEWFFC